MKIEIGQYKEVNKGSLKGFFSFIIQPEGMQFTNCSYFEKDGANWFNFPQKEYKKQDGSTGYQGLINLLNKEYSETLKSAVTQALKEHINGKGTSAQTKANTVQSEASSLPF